MKVYEDIDAMEKLRKQEEKLTNETLEALNNYNKAHDTIFPQYYYKPETTNLFDVIKQKSEKTIIKHELLKLYHYYEKMSRKISDYSSTYFLEPCLQNKKVDLEAWQYYLDSYDKIKELYYKIAIVLYEDFKCRNIDIILTYENRFEVLENKNTTEYNYIAQNTKDLFKHDYAEGDIIYNVENGCSYLYNGRSFKNIT